MLDVALRGGTLVDGTGAPPRRLDIGIADGRIVAVGLDAQEARESLDVVGLVVAPGFIDIHSHSDATLLVDPRARSAIAQGVTTEVVGNCGHAPAPLVDPADVPDLVFGYNPALHVDWTTVDGYLQTLQRVQPAVNVATLAGHIPLRLAALGRTPRPATAAELDHMVHLLGEAFDAGAYGFSSGLEYPLGLACTTDELVALARATGRRGGYYAIHTRDRDFKAVEAFDEAFDVGRRAEVPLQVSHLTPRYGAPPGASARALQAIDDARARGEDVACDQHTRLHGLTKVVTMLPPTALEGGTDELLRRLRDPDTRAEYRAFPQPLFKMGLMNEWERIALFEARHSPEWVGKDFKTIGEERSQDPLDALMDILLEAGDDAPNVLMTGLVHTEDELEQTFVHASCMPESDATALATDGPLAGQSFLGAYTWATYYLRRLVRERAALSLQEGIHRLTGLPARRLGVSDRGVLCDGAWADVVVFDPDTIAEQGTLHAPNQYATGVRHVLVNGRFAMRDGSFTDDRAGSLEENPRMSYEVRVLFDIKMKARDGVLLSNDVYLPRAPGPFPTIVTRTPYENSGENFMNWGIWWAQHGYAAVIGDTRGRYDSGGDFYPWINDPNDGDDTFEWVARQAWCDGKIGTWGRSYGGVNQWYQMPRSNPLIASTSPQVTPADNWESAHYVNGASQWGLNTLIVPVWNVSLRAAGRSDLYNWDRIFRTLPLRDADLEMIGRRCDYFQDWYEHPTYDDYWKQFQWDNQYNRVHVPTRNQSGWYDAYPFATFKSWRSSVEEAPDPIVKRQQRVLMGPWSHADPTSSRLGDLDFGPTAWRSLAREDLRWYDATLRGIDNGILDEPRIDLFVMGANEWRLYEDWPVPGTEFTAWYLHSRGRANSLFGDGVLSVHAPDGTEPSDRYTYDPDLPVPTLGGNHSMGGWPGRTSDPVPVGPLDQRPLERRDDVLVFTSDPMTSDTEVIGPISAVLYAASSARDTDWVVKLVDVHPDGRAIVLADGIRRARYRGGRVPPELIQPGEVYRYELDLAPTANVFKTGHRIRVDVTSSNFPRFDRNLNTGDDIGTGTRMLTAQQTVLHTADYPSHLLLPMVPR